MLFAGTTFLSAYTLTYSNFHGNLPGYDSRKIRNGDNSSIDPDKAAFSMAPHDDDYERVNMTDHDATGGSTAYGGAGGYNDNSYSSGGNPYSADDFDDPNRYGSLPPRNNNAMFDSDLEYNSGAAAQPPRQSSPYGGAQSDPYNDTVQFPSGNYDRTVR